MNSKGEENSDGGHFDDRCKGFVVVKAEDLCESFSDKASFESWICIVWVLDFEYPFGSDAFAVGRPWNKAHGFVFCKGK